MRRGARAGLRTCAGAVLGAMLCTPGAFAQEKVVPAPALGVTGGDRELTATWEHPLPGTPGLTFGVRYRKAGTSTWTRVDASSDENHQNFGGNVTSATIPGHEGGTLEDNANYEVQVRGGKWNEGYNGWGSYSGTETSPTLPAAPTKPTLTVANLGSGKVQVASSVTGAATLTGWEYKKKAGEGNYDADWTEISSTSSSLSHTVTGLVNGTAYKFKVRAANASGAGAASAESDAATPAATATLAASNVEDDTATLTIASHSGDWYYKYTAPSTPAGTCSTVVSNSTTASLTDLTPGTSYTFKAYDDGNCAIELTTSTGAATFLTKPGQATGVTATSGATSLAVGWTALSGTVTGYKVQWKTISQQYNTGDRQNTVTTGTTNTITGLTNGTAYTVRVTAYNTTGDGDPSAEATGTPSATFTVTALNPAKAPEGGTATYTIVLNTQPTQNVTVALAKQSGGDADLSVSPASLTFTNANWNQPQAVTVTAAQDSDLTDGTATIAHTVTSTDPAYSSATIANVTVTEADDDATGVLVSETAVTATEGGPPGTYTLRLATLPSADVTIDLARQSGGDADLTFSPGQLTFTVEGWDLPQTVTVSAAHDSDTADGTATITHTATSSDASYNGIAIPSVTATEDDDDIRAVLSKTAVSVPEGGSATYTVALAGKPTANVTIAVAKQSGGDDDLTVSPASLTFTTTNWGTAQTVTVSAAQDDGYTAGTATIGHTATSTDSNFNGMTIPGVTATEDDDEKPGVTLSASSLTVAEGDRGTYTVVLDVRPANDVVITLGTQTGADPNLRYSPGSLTFTRGDWNQAQTVTVTAAEDDDALDGTAIITHTATSVGADYNGIAVPNVAVAETDNDTAGVTVTTRGEGQIVGLGYINEGGSKSYTVVLDTQPAADVTIAVANRGGVGHDADLKASPATLTFTTSNWNQAQTVTVSAGEDDDGLNGFAEFDHTATSTDTDYDGISIWSIRAWEQDNDKVRVSTTSLAMTEGGSTLSYTVVLATQPAANVTLTRTISPGNWATATHTFTPENWHTPATFSIGESQDQDEDDETYTITHTATSTDSNFNNTPVPSIAVTAYDDDKVGLVVSATSLAVAEGSSVTYTAKLRKLPSNNVVVNLSANPGSDSDLTVSPTSLTFTTGTWNTTQTVTVTAAQDNDGLDGAAQFVHAGASTNADTDWRGDLKVYANGIPADHVTATENDDETPAVTVSETVVTVDEGATATYTVKLAVEPVADVTIHLGNRRETGDDDDLTVNPKILTFTTTDYGTAQTVTVSAAEDDDASNGRAIITHTALSTGSDYNRIEIGNVAATESDNDSDIDIVLAGVPDQAWHRNEAIGTVTLPTATGGNGTLTHALSPSTLPAGVTYDATAKTLGGTPTATTASRTYTWTATDEDGDTASQSFTIEVSGPNTAPTSANATLSVSRDNRTAIPLSSLSYADADGHSLRAIRIVTLPGASDGTLGTVKTGIYDGAGAASTVLCVGTIDAVAAGQEIPDVLSTALYFCPKDDFKSASFGFKVIDSEGRASDKTYTATLVAPPGQVTGLTATAGNAYVRLSWTNPRNPAITGYEYRRKSGVGDWGGWTAMTGSGAATTSHSVSGLTNATAYSFQVRARTSAGAGDIDSAEVSATPSASASVPAKPTGLQVLNQGAAEGETYVQVRLIWNDPKDPSITRYEAEREFSGSKGNWLNPLDSSGNTQSNNHLAGSGPTTTSAQFRAGSNENTYAFRLRAVNAAGNGPWSDTVSLELSNEGITPVLNALEPGNGRVRLRWTHDGTNLESEGAYWGYCSGPPDTCTSTNIPSSQANAAARSHVLSGLTNGSTYTYAIYSFASPAADGVSRDILVSNTRTITLPAAPAKPTGLTASATADGASLAWTDPNSAIITGYEYRYKVGSAGTWGAWTRVPGSDGATTSASVAGVGGTTYKFQVRALIEYAAALGGTLAGAASDEASVSPVSVVVSTESLALDEGGSGSYTVKLGDAPTGNVVITVTVDSDGTVTADTDESTTGD